MTDEQIEGLLTEIGTELDRLAKDEAKQGKEERKRQWMLRTRRDILFKLKAARAQGNRREEMKTLALYGMFMLHGHRNILLVNLFMAKFRGGIL